MKRKTSWMIKPFLLALFIAPLSACTSFPQTNTYTYNDNDNDKMRLNMQNQETNTLYAENSRAGKNSAQKGRSVQEAVEKVKRQGHKIDTNGDGIIDQKEKDAKKGKLGFASGFIEKFLDANGDGIITVKEYIDVQSEEIKKADTNKDGYISEEEEKQRKKAFVKQAFRYYSG